jgi:tetratricopeptide (TPR) repeat protein
MKNNKWILILLVSLFSFSTKGFGNELLLKAEKAYDSKNYKEAITNYEKLVSDGYKSYQLYFNLGNSLYKNALEIKASKQNLIQGGKKVTTDSLANLVFDEAAGSFAQVANSISNKDTLHQAWHNIGNCYLQKKDYQQAFDAYKKSLKYDPKDEETRYNMAYALKNIPKDKKGGGGSSNQKEEDKKDKNKNSTPQQNQMNKEQAEQLLKALMNQEKKLQDKRKQKQEDAGKTSVDKDW